MKKNNWRWMKIYSTIMIRVSLYTSHVKLLFVHFTKNRLNLLTWIVTNFYENELIIRLHWQPWYRSISRIFIILFGRENFRSLFSFRQFLLQVYGRNVSRLWSTKLATVYDKLIIGFDESFYLRERGKLRISEAERSVSGKDELETGG